MYLCSVQLCYLVTCLVAHDYRPVTLVTLAVSILCSSLLIIWCFAPSLHSWQLYAVKPYQMSGFVPPGVSRLLISAVDLVHRDQYFYKEL